MYWFIWFAGYIRVWRSNKCSIFWVSDSTQKHAESRFCELISFYTTRFNVSSQGSQWLHPVWDPNPETRREAAVSQVMSSELKQEISIPQCQSWLSQNYTYQSTHSCAFPPCFVYRAFILNSEALLDKQLLVSSELDCRYCKIKNRDKPNVSQNVEAFEARQTDGEKKKNYNSTNLYQWMIN